jgi:beta-glucosidase
MHTTLQFQLRNAGSIVGAEVAQVYITLPPSSGEPFQRLAGWQGVQLAPGESKTVTVPLDPAYLSIFDVASDKWKLLAGDYTIAVGTASDAAHLAGSVHVQWPEGDAIPVPAAGEMASRRAEW